MDLLHKRLDLDRAQEQPAPFLRERLLGGSDGPAGSSDEKDVDVFSLGKFAHSLDNFEGTLGVRVDENDARTLDRDPSDEHRRRDVDDRMAGRPQRERQPLALGTHVHNENGRHEPASTPVQPRSRGHVILRLAESARASGSGPSTISPPVARPVEAEGQRPK